MNGDKWLEWEVDKLLEMVKAGEPFSIIATAVGHSRNACIGQHHRIMDKANKAKGIVKPTRLMREKQALATRQIPENKPALLKFYVPEKGPKSSLPKPMSPDQRRKHVKDRADGISLLTAESHQCRWPIELRGKDGFPRCCGAETVVNDDGLHSSWCAYHKPICFLPARPKSLASLNNWR